MQGAIARNLLDGRSEPCLALTQFHERRWHRSHYTRVGRTLAGSLGPSLASTCRGRTSASVGLELLQPKIDRQSRTHRATYL